MQFWCAPWKGLQGHPITAILRSNEKFHFKTIFKKGSRWLTDLFLGFMKISQISITTSIARAKGDLSMIFELTALVDEILLPDMIKSIQNKNCRPVYRCDCFRFSFLVVDRATVHQLCLFLQSHTKTFMNWQVVFNYHPRQIMLNFCSW